MPKAPGGGKSGPGSTSFESMTHEQLRALLSSADMSTAMSLAGKLTAAAKTIYDIGDELKTRIKLVNWEGTGAEAFKNWGDQTASATLNLSEYASNAGKWMEDVSQAIAEAHANMPPQSDTDDAKAALKTANTNLDALKDPANRHDPDRQTLTATYHTKATGAEAQLESTRLQAAQQMQKLAQTYVQSGTQINRFEPPTFPPPASYLGNTWVQPNTRKETPGNSYSGGGMGGAVGNAMYSDGGSSGGSKHYQPPGSDSALGVAVSGSHGGSHDVPNKGHVPQDPPVHLGIDSVDTAPPGTLPSAHSTTPPPNMNQVAPRPEGPPLPPPGAIPPAFGGSYGQQGGGRPGAMAPGRTFPGGAGGRPPALGTGGLNSRTPLGRESGIVGGRPVQSPSGRPPNRIPRGMVIGGEEGNGRQMMGRGMAGGGMGHGGAGGAGSGMAGGRRLASETGGVVGGRPQAGGRNSARPFTPGGSGLVRGATSGSGTGTGSGSGAMGRGGMAGAGRGRGGHGEEEHGERPDYLTEDEETWQQGDRRIVPPVID